MYLQKGFGGDAFFEGRLELPFEHPVFHAQIILEPF